MPQEKRDDVLWVRFPNEEVEISIMSHNGQVGILILPNLEKGGRAVMDRAVEMGFAERRRTRGGSAAVFLRDPEKGFPFNVKELAQKLGGVTVRIPKAVFEAEKYPRRPAQPDVAVNDTPFADVGASPAEPELSAAEKKRIRDEARMKKLREEAEVELAEKAVGIADDGAGDEISKILMATVWGPDEVIVDDQGPQTEDVSPDEDDDSPKLI